MKIAIVIVTYNGIGDTRRCLTSLQKLRKTKDTIEIVVVDNASTDNTVSAITQDFPHVAIFPQTKNLGFAEGNNVGIRYALVHKADFIMLLNNDTFVAPDMLTRLLDVAARYPKGAIFCPKIYFAAGAETHKSRYKPADLGRVIWYVGGLIDWKNVLASHRGVDEVDTGQYNDVVKTSYATGCAMFVRREVFEKVGLLDPKFYLYYEDLDFSLRARKSGNEVYYAPPATVWHKNAGSGGGTGSDLQSYYITRNRLIIGMRYAPWRTKLALFREATNLVMHGTPTQRQAVGDFLRKKFGERKITPVSTNQKPKITFPQMPNLLKYFKPKNPKTKT